LEFHAKTPIGGRIDGCVLGTWFAHNPLEGVNSMDVSTFLLIRGLVGVLIGILAVTWPGMTIAVLVIIFGLYAVVDGVTNLILGLSRTRTHGRSWALSL